ncbi:putative inactive disease susceptibility protein LOV1 [Rosa rugosa]|uniref:putative inactive disease susceptibility protein LOV1 n=1 Tax=Rosa rugosa TaxID=74645 RepID=UPI002B40FC03|nr:putative inactive disease susceptibility protein LOV1 [Rosa rugosa]
MAGVFDLCCIFLGFYVLCVVASELAYRYSKGKYKWIKRELKFLSALLKDFDEVTMSGNQITQEIGVTMQVMKEREENWKKRARTVADEATLALQSFAKLTKRRSYHKRLLYVILDPVAVVDAVLAMNMFEQRINNIVGMNRKGVKQTTGASDINVSLEQSRSKIRSLMNRFSVDEIESVRSRPPRADELTLYPKYVTTGHLDLLCGIHHEQIKSAAMHLQLLHAFMEDLQRLKVVESDMERCWMTEAIETIEEAKAVINRNQRMWLSEFSDGMARRKLKKGIMHIGARISDLQETKEKYGIKFIRRQSSKSANRFPQQHASQYLPTTDDTCLSSPVRNIRNWLSQVQETSTNSVQDELEQVHKLLQHTKGTEDYGAVNLRNTCWELLKKKASEADQQLMSNIPSRMILTRIKNTLSLLLRCLQVYSIEVRVDSCSVVGLEEDIHALVSTLTTESGSASSIISIVGMKGIGKTTLAKKVYDHDAIRSHFKVRRWVSIPQQYDDENALFSSAGNQVLETQNKGYEKQLLMKSMQDFFKELGMKNSRCLLIFDNVSSNKEMYALKTAFSPGRNGSIVLITRNKTVGSNADQNSIPHQVRLRTKEESWELFSQMVEFSAEEMTSAKEVVGWKLGGLPLDIMTVGFLLWGKKVTSEEVFRAVDRITQGQNQSPWSENLAMIEEELQFHMILRKCFSYFKLFPRESEIPIRRILASLVAQGFVQLSRDQKINLESVALEYLSELIGRSMIQVVQRKPNGMFKTCRMPPAVHDLLFEDKAKQSFSYATTGFEGQLAFQFDDNGTGASFLPIHGLNTSLPNALRKERILVFENGEGNKPRMEGEFLGRRIMAGAFSQLLVLDFECVSVSQLPTILGKLKQLAYLGLRRTELETIPASIGNLVNLQTLDLKHTHVHTLPGSIWKLKNLRHLYMHQRCRIKFMALPTAISMRNLQTLSGIFLGKINLVKDRLDKLIHLRKLELAFQLKPTEQKVLEKWIVKLTCLQSLKLKSFSANGELPKLERISDLKNLHSLYLFGKLEYSFITRLPESLTHLTLAASSLRKDPMPELGKLPKLKSLSLKSGSYQGTGMVCSTDYFPLLFVLKLWNLDTLGKLDLHEGAMQNLREFEIKFCNNFTSTTGLEHLKNLQKYRVN